MRRSHALALSALLGVVLVPTFPAGADAAARRAESVDECRLLTTTQAATIMGAKPFGPGAPDNEGCSWQTDPYDRENLAYVTVEVQPLAEYRRSYPDVRTYLDESTTVGINRLPGVGSEAYSTYSALSGPGSSDGITVRVGKQVLSVGFQAARRVEEPSPEFDRIVRIVKKMVADLRRA